MEDSYFVYAHTNTINGKKYFGITKDISSRWGHEGSRYIGSSCKAFSDAIKKYGWGAFSHEILHSNISKEEACALEKKYISEFKTNICRYGDAHGYNMTDGGEGVSGGYDKNGTNNPFFGKHHTQQTKERLSEILAGQRSGVSSSNYGTSIPNEQRRAISKSLKEHYSKNECSHKRPVYCVTDDIWFDSVKDASEYYSISCSLISGCCIGVALTTHGKQFTHNADGSLPEYNSRYLAIGNGRKRIIPNARAVKCVETGNVYQSAAMAAKAVGLKYSNGIRKSCKDNKYASGGFHWVYVNNSGGDKD